MNKFALGVAAALAFSSCCGFLSKLIPGKFGKVLGEISTDISGALQAFKE